MDLDLTGDPIELATALVDIPSVSLDERRIADAVETALRTLPTAGLLEIVRTGHNVVARTQLGKPQRVILAGHLDTVPIADNVPSQRDGDVLRGCGTVDMKSGDAVFLHVLAKALVDPDALNYDVTVLFYEAEEIAAEFNGLGKIGAELPDWLLGDLAILGEPTDAVIEAGCQGTLRVRLTATGVRAHSARSWLGDNAIHRLADALDRLSRYEARTVDIDGCEYREGLSAIKIVGGVAGNVVPDEASLEVNFRFAPDRSVEQAFAHCREVFDGLNLAIELTDSAAGAHPGLAADIATRFVEAAGGQVRAKYGWTDVSRFAALGIPALNYGPGDPNLAHTREEWVNVQQITDSVHVLHGFLTGG